MSLTIAKMHWQPLNSWDVNNNFLHFHLLSVKTAKLFFYFCAHVAFRTTWSLWAFSLLKMSKRTKQRATIEDKYCFCFTHLNLRFPLTLRRVCSPFFSFQTLWRWIATTTAKWENDYIGRKKDQNQSGSGSFSAVPEEPGNFLVLLPRWLEAQPTGGGVGVGRGDGWDIEQDERAESWWVRVRQFQCKQHSYEPSQCGFSVLFIIFCKQAHNSSNCSELVWSQL